MWFCGLTVEVYHSWYIQHYVWLSHSQCFVAMPGLLSRFQSARAYKQKTWLYHCHTVKYNPLRDQSLRFQLIEGMESVKTVRFIRPQLPYFSFASCNVNIDHVTPHATSHTMPSHFSVCNIERLGMGLGTRLVRRGEALLMRLYYI